MADKAETNIATVAGLLRTQREKQKLTLEAVSRDICVRSCFLAAMEDGRYHDLPELTFALGFVKAYAKALGLNPADIAAQFKTEYLEAQGTEEAPTPSAAALSVQNPKAQITYKVNTRPKRSWPAWLSPVVGLVGAGLSWMWIGSSSVGVISTAAVDEQTEVRMLAALAEMPTVSDAPEVARVGGAEDGLLDATVILAEAHVADSHETETETTSFFTPAFTPAANASAPVQSGTATQSITLEASEDSWIQLTYTDGTELWSGVLRAGQTYRPELVGDVFLTTSNAGGIMLRQYGETLGPLGQRGAMVESLALDGSAFTRPRQAGSAVSATGSAGE